MKNYLVRIPMTGVIEAIVTASSEEQAIIQALEEVDINNIYEWKAHKQIVEENTFHGVQNEAQVEHLICMDNDELPEIKINKDWDQFAL
ncbi:hypothetical protein [Chlorogloeopsis sp. ULAP02]|uniref:hypothetical protein n=1 Tax=Chlorogloeopsis sp. ULAP02 TaxID=3107926 RepID=UPI003134BB66